jgi:hypothetical protein
VIQDPIMPVSLPRHVSLPCWVLALALAPPLGGCSTAGTAGNLAPGSTLPQATAPALAPATAGVVKTADTSGNSSGQAKEKSKGFGGFGGSKAPAEQSPSLLPQIGPKVKARGADEAYQLTADEI